MGCRLNYPLETLSSIFVIKWVNFFLNHIWDSNYIWNMISGCDCVVYLREEKKRKFIWSY